MSGCDNCARLERGPNPNPGFVLVRRMVKLAGRLMDGGYEYKPCPECNNED
jgi:hypothetical protein